MIRILHAALLVLAVIAGAQAGAGESVESFYIELPGDGIAVTHGGDLVLAAGPPGIPLLGEERIRNGLALLVKLRDAGGNIIGFASELETFPENADHVNADVLWDTDWTLMIPGRGSLYLRQQEHSRGLGPKVIRPTLETGRPWEGEWTVTTTAGPRPDGRGVVVGGAGEFEGVRGSFVEIVTLTRYEQEGVLHGRVELRITLERDPTP
jgi:hypothetical protein